MIPPFYFTAHWKALRRRVLRRDKHICRYCGGYAVQADHVIPRSKGGADTMRNLVAACPRCNALCGGKRFKDLREKKEWVRRELGIKKSTTMRTEW